MATKLPSFQFYPGDWMTDPAVRCLSHAAKGLWIDMICLMHLSSRKGYLQHATGKPVTDEELCLMTGCSPDAAVCLLRELERVGTFSRTEDGTIFCRRIVRDEAIRQFQMNMIAKAATQQGPLPFKRPRKQIRDSIRKDVLAEGRCAHCGSDGPLTVDHKTPWSWGGGNERENLQALCWDCNLVKLNRWADGWGIGT